MDLIDGESGCRNIVGGGNLEGDICARRTMKGVNRKFVGD